MPDVFELKEFYETEAGRFTCLNLREQLLQLWPDAKKEKILGFGFALPYLPIYAYGNSCIAFMPPLIGAMKIEHSTPCVMADGLTLPAKNEFFDRIIIIHGVEATQHEEKFFEEIWRVLKPNGRVIVIAPNEAGLLRKFKTPFSHTKAYSRLKLLEYLRSNKLQPRRLRRALFGIPCKNKFFNKLGEFFGTVFLRPYCGVFIIEAEKVIFAPGGRPIKIAPSIWDKIFKPKVVRA